MTSFAWHCRGAGNSKSVLIAFLCVVLASCIGPNIEDWPDTIPDTRVFRAVYATDEENQRRQSEAEYLAWVLSFYEGNLAYQSGWRDIQSYVFEAPDPDAARALREQLRQVGIAIGSEWSRHNDIRRIDSRMLSLWGSTIQLAADFDTQKLMVEIISTDIELLLAGGLRKQDILEERYADILGLEPFGDF